MKSGWYGEWQEIPNEDVEDEKYVNEAISRIRNSLINAIAKKLGNAFVIEDEHAVVRKKNVHLDLTNPDIVSSTVGWKGYFKFEDEAK